MEKGATLMSLVIGLTGSIATGKSTVSNMFKQLNIPVIDADQIARDVVEPEQVALKEIVEAFGTNILHDDGSLNRKALGDIVFNDKEKLEILNGIVHPAIRNEMNRQKEMYLAQNIPCIVLDIPLLFENKLDYLVDKILVVYIDEETQLKRLMDRDQSTREDAMSRIKSQISIEVKKEKAHEVINNSGTVEESFKQLKEILKNWHVNVSMS